MPEPLKVRGPLKQAMYPIALAAIYTLLGLLWIFISDRWLLTTDSDTDTFTQINLIKDGLFVLITAALLYWLMTSKARLVQNTRSELETSVQERTAELSAANAQLQSEAAQRQRTEAALRESEARYRSVVETQSELICRFLADGTLTFINSTYCRYFGRTAEELLGCKFTPLIPPDDLAIVEQALASLGPGNPTVTIEHRVIKPSGEVAWQQWIDSIITNGDGQVLELQGVGRDITERKRAEDKLRRLQAELAQAARLSTLGEMAKSLAHELNQPLTAIVTYAQACLNLLKAGGEQTKQLTGALEQVVAEGLRAGEVIRRTRTLAQTRSSRWETLDLNVMIRDIVAFVAWKARQYAVSIRLELADNLPPLTLDITQIQQILLNLLNNSIEMLSAHCKERQITLSTSATDATVEIAVADSGPGLSSADLEDLFNSFFTAKPDKVGVGLALSRSLAEAQGGRLRAAPNPEHGNTFYLTLPLHQKIPSDET